ncbi:TioE family transcriptional regulator [Phytomonospora endophytica]|uniref:DNA-binding transcriptional MerR regulator n=1 Tax=Phytomonospora endophytica TaxID=714109 RepID=A0A841FKN5_9ACTN|nr:TioE family transcriptional regulator [Phytomonospora endophytica]MBB6036726.1 DNA-binding transcriptional MerR regulator [Phytomonospora endophytica]GIG68240.1 MerR family transcriptional regulator [Phytomonospora endophytica]
MKNLRPAVLAREHGISTQAVRNYERDGFIPPADRTQSGYRIYTETHAAALRAFLSLITAHGHAIGGRIMVAVHDGRLDDALAAIDQGHAQLRRDRSTLHAVTQAIGDLTTYTAPSHTPTPRTIGELAHRLDLTPATLRNWETAGILAPVRDPATGYRVFGDGDVRDAELAHLLRRGGYPLDHIATVVEQVRTAGGTDSLSGALDDWRRRLTARGLAMLDAAGHLGRYLRLGETLAP